MNNPEQLPLMTSDIESGKAESLLLDLLQKARAQRDMDVSKAALDTRKRDDELEENASLASIMARDTIDLHRIMLRRNARLNRMNFFRHHPVKLDRGEITHIPRSLTWRNHYFVSTPVLFATEEEFIDGASVSEGYIFMTTHPQYKRDDRSVYVSIDRVVKDSFTGVDVRQNEYAIHAYNSPNGNLKAHLSGGLTNEQSQMDLTEDLNHPRYLSVIGLLRMAQIAIKQ